MKVRNAILILGPGKSGTTLLNDILSFHPNIYWISNYVNKNPEFLFLSAINNVYKFPYLAGKIAKLPKSPRACEPFLFFSHYMKEFHRNESTFKKNEIRKLQRAISKINDYHKGSYFLTKFTGPPRLEFIEQVFDKPLIIWLDRDPKAILASYYRSKWRYKNSIEEFRSKNTQEILKEYAAYYKYLNREKNKLQKLDLKIVKYEDLVKDPVSFIEELLDNLNLKFPASYLNLLNSWNIKKNRNRNYQSLFSQKDVEYIDQLFQ